MANWIPESADGDSENRREYTQKPLYMMTEIQKIGENILILITQQGCVRPIAEPYAPVDTRRL